MSKTQCAFLPVGALIDELPDGLLWGLADPYVGDSTQVGTITEDFGLMEASWEKDDNGAIRIALFVAVLKDLAVKVAEVEGVALILKAEGETVTVDNPCGVTVVGLSADVRPFQFAMSVQAKLRFSRDLLKPVKAEEKDGEEHWVEDESEPMREVELGELSFGFGKAPYISYAPAMNSLKPSMIGDTGVVLEIEDLYFRFGDDPDVEPPQWITDLIDAGELDADWRGVALTQGSVYLPELRDEADGTYTPLALKEMLIDKHGFRGVFELAETELNVAKKLSGFAVLVESVKLEFKQWALISGALDFSLELRLFDLNGGTANDPKYPRLPLALTYSQDGGLHLAVREKQGQEKGQLEFPQADPALGSALARRNGTTGQQDLLALSDWIDFQLDTPEPDFKARTITFSGKVTLKFAKDKLGFEDDEGNALAFEVEKLVVNAQGKVTFEGGWVDLPTQKKSKIGKTFKAELSKIGFGSEDEWSWIGFSGSVQLATKISLGAEFHNAKIMVRKGFNPLVDPWQDNLRFTLQGLDVNLEIPDVLAFTGKLSFFDDQEEDADKALRGFRGAVKLTLYPSKFVLDAELMCLKVKQGNTSFTAFYVYVNANLPAGLPLASTGVSLYGFAGLFGQNVFPDRLDAEDWYEHWYKGERLGTTPLPDEDDEDPGVVQATKWMPEPGSRAFGAGVTFGTSTDNGYAVNGKLLFVLLVPGPVLILSGRANLLKERSKLDDPDSEPNFETLAVLDGRAGTFQLNVSAYYKKDEDSGKILDIRAGVESFFAFHDADAWYLYLGRKDPKEKRIRAEVLRLIRADTYWMLDARSLQFGFFLGMEKRWKFGPVTAGLAAWISVDAAVSWKDVHAHGALELYGGLELKFLKRGLTISVWARIAVDAPKPLLVEGEVHVEVDLPRPIPDLDFRFKLRWGKQPGSALVPVVLGGVGIEHFKASEKWPLWRLPAYEGPKPGFWDGQAHPYAENLGALLVDYDEAVEQGVPTVPLDARPVLAFAKAVRDGIGFAGAREGLLERVGATRFEYELVQVVLQQQPAGMFVAQQPDQSPSTGAWVVVARRSQPGLYSATPDIAPERLRGSWQLVSSGGDGLPNVRLLLWGKSSSDWAREQTGSQHWTWLNSAVPLDCLPRPESLEHCVSWEEVAPGTRFEGECRREVLVIQAGTPRRTPGANTLLPLVMLCEYAPRGAYRLRHALCITDEIAGEEPPPPDTRHFAYLPLVAKAARLRDGAPAAPLASRGETRSPLEHGAIAGGSHSDAVGHSGQSALAQQQAEIPVVITIDAFPYGTSRVVVYLDGPPSSSALAFQAGEAVAGPATIDPAAAGGPSITLNAAPGKAIERVVISSGSGREGRPCLYRICYTAPLNPSLAEAGDAWAEGVAETVAMWKQTDNLLEPDSLYRLVVVSRARRDGTPETFVEHVYFRTEGAPGVAALPSGAALQYESPELPEGGSPPAGHEHFPIAGPLKSLRPYVARTLPLAEERAFYRGYDIVAEFNENYVRDLFDKGGTPLALRVVDATGALVAGLTGQWGQNPVLALGRTELEQLHSLAAACAGASLPGFAVPGDLPADEALAAMPALEAPLAPLTRHEVHLVAAKGAVEHIVYRWSFVSSRYTCFRHHLASFAERVWSESIPPFAHMAELRGLLALATATPPATSTGEGVPIFDQIAWRFGLATEPKAAEPGRSLRAAPARVELTEIRDSAARYALLLASPEPIDPERAWLDLGFGGAWSGPFVHREPGPAKLVAVLAGGAEEHVDLVALEDLVLDGWRIEHGPPQAPPTPQPTYFSSFPPGTTCAAGTVARVHTLAGSQAGGETLRHLGPGTSGLLGSTGNRLRLVDAEGRVVHDREFAEPGRFDGLAPIWVWNGDHTAAFLFLPDLASDPNDPPTLRPIPDGLFSILASYQRTTGDPLAPIRRQRGDGAEEVGSLDFVLGPG